MIKVLRIVSVACVLITIICSVLIVCGVRWSRFTALEARVAGIQADLRRMEVRRIDGFKVDGVPSPVWVLTWKVAEAAPAPPPATQPALTPEVEEGGK